MNWKDKYIAIKKYNEETKFSITEFKLTDGTKAYLSAILDLYDNSIILMPLDDRVITFLFLKPLTKQLPPIVMPSHFSTVTETFNMQVSILKDAW